MSLVIGFKLDFARINTLPEGVLNNRPVKGNSESNNIKMFNNINLT